MTATSFEGDKIVPDAEPSLKKSEAESAPRKVLGTVLAIEQAEGAGARVRRSIGTARLRNITPFLMLDHFNVAQQAGFPDHPHRGMETITYMISGAVDHEDFTGGKGTIWPGDLQFMTAGRGLMHSEMPHQEAPDPATGERKPIVGMQLWVDLPQHLKDCEPRYRDLRASEIPITTLDDGKVTVKVISGQSNGVESVQELAYTPVWFLDIKIKPGGKIKQNVPQGWNTFAYILSGSVRFGSGDDAQLVEQYHNTVFERTPGDSIVAEVPEDTTEEAQFILVSGQPHHQPIFQHGPFVVGSKEEAYQALLDFQTSSNGFERALGWQSEIGRHMM